MSAFDRLLHDPADAELTAALEEAGRPADEGGPGRWLATLRAVAGRAEGSSLPGQRRDVFVAWWTDHRGCKQVRVRGGDRAAVGAHLSRLDHDERPPLWHVHPDGVYRLRRGGGVATWTASCACGATGRPHELAWMGPRCGPCHDRREEGDPAAVVETRTVLSQGHTVHALAFDPTGLALAASPGRRSLRHVRLPDGPDLVFVDEQDVGGVAPPFAPLAFSPDGRWLAVGEPLAGQPVLWPFPDALSATALARIVPLELDANHGSPVCDMAFSDAGDHFAACDDARRGRLFRWTGALWAEVRSFRGATAVAFSPDGQTLAVGGSGGAVRLFSTDSGATRGQVNTGARSDEEVLFLAWLPGDGGLLLLTGSGDAARGPHEQQLRRWDLSRRRETHHGPFGTPALLALSPDGGHLAGVYHDDRHSPAAVHFWDLAAWREAGWVEWDPEDALHALAFSPDGQTLATGSQRGRIKLVPWRLLLEG